MLFSRRQVGWGRGGGGGGGGQYLYGDEDDDDQDVIFAQFDATTGMGNETFAITFVPEGSIVNRARRRYLII